MAAAGVVRRCIRSVLPSIVRCTTLQHVSQSRPSPTHYNVITCSPPLTTRHLSSVPDPPDYEINLTPQQLDDIKSECYLVDVRQPEELVVDGAIPGVHNVPLGEVGGHAEHFPDDITVFICQGGVRSLKALSLALQAGVEKPRHLQGGMNAWHATFRGK